MKKYARIINNLVVETFIPPLDVDITECFHPDVVAQFVECPTDVQQNWEFDGTNYKAPVVVITQKEITND
jgi:hypothetical protein